MAQMAVNGSGPKVNSSSTLDCDYTEQDGAIFGDYNLPWRWTKLEQYEIMVETTMHGRLKSLGWILAYRQAGN